MSRSIVFIILAIFIYKHGQAQDDKVVTPQYLNQLYYVADSNKLSDLEKIDAAMKTKSKLAGFGGVSSTYVMEDPTPKFKLVIHNQVLLSGWME